MVNKAIELAETHGWFLTRQFENEANADMHSRTTAREIVGDFDGRAARLLGDGLRYGRHAEGRCARPCQGAAGYEDHRLRAGRRADAHQRSRSRNETRTALPRPAIRRSSRTRCKAGARISFPKLTGDAVSMGVIDRILRDSECRRDALEQATRPEGRDLRRHHVRRNLCRERSGSARKRPRAQQFFACCPTPVSAI